MGATPMIGTNNKKNNQQQQNNRLKTDSAQGRWWFYFSVAIAWKCSKYETYAKLLSFHILYLSRGHKLHLLVRLNLSSGFETRADSNQPAQLHSTARYSTLACRRLSSYTSHTAINKGADQSALMRRLICAFVVRMQQSSFFAWPKWGIWFFVWRLFC